MIPVIGHKGYCRGEIKVHGAEGPQRLPGDGRIPRSSRPAACCGRSSRIGEELRADADPLFAHRTPRSNVG